MTEAEKLKLDIDTLRESIHLRWLDMASLPISADERRSIRQEINSCVDNLRGLIERLDKTDA